jgi:hypothetical protein
MLTIARKSGVAIENVDVRAACAHRGAHAIQVLSNASEIAVVPGADDHFGPKSGRFA